MEDRGESNGTFQIEPHDPDTYVLTPLVNLGELEYGRIERDGQFALERIDKSKVKNIVVDFCNTEYCGSTALGFLLRIWKRTRGFGGHMALCNVSPQEMEILTQMRLDSLWSICDSMEDALRAVHDEPTEGPQ